MRKKFTGRARITALQAERQLKEGRKAKQSEIVEATGVPANTISKWANRKLHLLDLDVAYKLCDYFGCSLNDLIERAIE